MSSWSSILGSALRGCTPRTRWGDRLYLTIRFIRFQNRLPRCSSPTSFNDHLFRMLAGDEIESSLRQMVSDKYQVKEYISSTVGPSYVIETHALLESNDDIARFSPPNIPCVIKPTHRSGDVIVVRNKNENIDKAKMSIWLKKNYYDQTRERNYRNLQPRIIVEALFSLDGMSIPDDYKVFCFNGVPKLIQVSKGRFSNYYRRTFYTDDWRVVPFTLLPAAAEDTPKPEFLDEMLSLSKKLSEPFSFIRVDFFVSKDQIRIGELTNCPESLAARFDPREYDVKVGRFFCRD